MSRLALGMIETVGLAAAIEAADTAVKSANVKLLGYEFTKGNGMVTVKLEGNVGAVNAAIQAGCAAAEKVNRVWSKTIIPRPHDEMHKLIITKETVGNMDLEENHLKEKQIENIKVDEMSSEKVLDITNIKNKEIKEVPKVEEVIEVEEIPDVVGLETVVEAQQNRKVENIDINKNEMKKKDSKKICNLCGDPECPRKKGEPRSLCIHYEEIKK